MRKRQYFAAGLFAFGYIAALAGSRADAMAVYPVEIELQEASTVKSTLRVTNDGARLLPVEFAVTRVDMDENGTISSVPASGDLTIFPPQATIAAGKSQVFQVKWNGNGSLAKSQTYFLSVNELPVKFAKSGSGMQLVMHFSVIVNVAPRSGKATLDLVTASIGKDAGGASRPQLLVENKGNRHVSIADASVTVSDGNWSETLSQRKLREIFGAGLVFPGKKRRFTLPLSLPAHVRSLKARVDYQNLAPAAQPR
jgi:P pilus assembly chaperone PapD